MRLTYTSYNTLEQLQPMQLEKHTGLDDMLCEQIQPDQSGNSSLGNTDAEQYIESVSKLQ